ncbi:MAG: MGMT family protein [Bacteroidota bacterium]
MPRSSRSTPVHDRARLGTEAEKDSAEDFYARVYAVVARIPHGRVTTYGRIARYLGVPRASRAVGWALKAVASSERSVLEIPCHRVVNREGRLTGRLHFVTPMAMEERLRAEGVEVTGGEQVDLVAYVWEPGRPGRQRPRPGGSVRGLPPRC